MPWFYAQLIIHVILYDGSNGVRPCEYAQIYCPLNANCDISCIFGTNACSFTNMYCPLNGSCNILCGDIRGCDLSFIHGPKDYPLTVECDKNFACFGTTIYAQNASIFTLHGCNIGVFECIGMTLWVPSNTIISGADDQFGTDNGNFMSIYAIHGLLDITFINYTGTFINNKNVTIYCLNGYTESCKLADYTNQWECDPNGNVLCNTGNPPSNMPTNNPTAILTTIPTQFPTCTVFVYLCILTVFIYIKLYIYYISIAMPSQSPTTKIPSKYPTLMPIAIPTAIPTVIPTQLPTRFPTGTIL